MKFQRETSGILVSSTRNLLLLTVWLIIPGPTSNHSLFRTLSNVFLSYVRSQHLAGSSSVSNCEWGKEKHPVRLSREGGNTDGEKHSQNITSRSIDFREDLVLLTQFRENMSQIFPYIDITILLDDHDTNPSRPMEALRNMICAHAASTIPDIDPNVFYRRALESLDEKTTRGSTVELIQSLLLLASFQQNNQRSVASWTSHALAVKAAYQLGIHVPSSYAERPEQEREMKRKLWSAVINHDRCVFVLFPHSFQL